MESRGTSAKLHDALDLITMVDELLSMGKLTPATLNGIRVNVRLVKEAMMAAQSESIGAPVRQSSPMTTEVPELQSFSQAPVSDSATLSDPDRIQMRRRDLRASIDRIVS